MTQRELDAMPSRLPEIKAAKAAAKAAAEKAAAEKAAAAAPAAEGEFADSYEDYTNPIDSSLNTPKRSMGGEMARSMGSEMDRGMEATGSEQPPKAKPVYDQKLLNELFKVATHSTFYGKNKGDVAMMGKIEDLLDEYGGELPKGMTPTKFALQLYRRL